jgi:hypothetical protein cdivTM_09551
MENEVLILNENENDIVRVKKKFVDKERMKYLTEAEFQKLKEILDEEEAIELKLIIMLQYSLCLRANEVLKLKCSDFERKSEKGKIYFEVFASNSKQKRSINKIKNLVINTEVSLLFLTVVNKCNLKKNDYICRTKHNKIMSKRNYDKYLKKIFKKANLSEDKAHSHIFRHSRAIHLLNVGLNIAQVQKILGHTNILNTMIYTKYSNYDINKTLLNLD